MDIFENFYLNSALIIAGAYLLGSFPSAYIAGKIKKIKINNAGSRNVGGMNTFYSGSRLAGVVVAAIDIGKGYLAGYLASVFSGRREINPLLKKYWLLFSGI